MFIGIGMGVGVGSSRRQSHLSLPGTAGNYASAPDSVAVSITGDIDLRVHAAMTDWTPAATSSLLTKWAAGQRSYLLQYHTNGLISLLLSADGTASVTATSSVAPTVTDGSAIWIRATWRQSDGRVQFFTSPDGVTWTQLGTDKSAAVASIFNSTAGVDVGSNSAGSAGVSAGKFYRAQVYSGSTVVFDANFAAQNPGATSFKETANGATVTLNGTAAIVAGP